MTRFKPSPATLIALLALFVALGGPAQAAKLINGKKIKRNTVTSKQIKARTLTASDISKKTLKSLRRKDASVTSAQIVDGSVTLAKLAFGSVTGNQVVDGSLSAVDLAADTITAAQLATGSVGNAELGADAVTNNKVATGAVSKGSIRNDAVGTEEVIDRSLTGVDVARASGTLTATSLGAVPAGDCEAQDFPVNGAAGTAVSVSAPAGGFVATARALNASSLRLQVCNPGEEAVDANGAYPFVAIAP